MKISKSVLVVASLALLAAGSQFAGRNHQNNPSTPTMMADGGAPLPPIPRGSEISCRA